MMARGLGVRQNRREGLAILERHAAEGRAAERHGNPFSPMSCCSRGKARGSEPERVTFCFRRTLGSLEGSQASRTTAATLRRVITHRDGLRESDRVVVPGNGGLVREHLARVQNHLAQVTRSDQLLLLGAATARPEDVVKQAAKFGDVSSSDTALVLRDPHRAQPPPHVLLGHEGRGRMERCRGRMTGVVDDASHQALRSSCNRAGTPCDWTDGAGSSLVAGLPARSGIATRRQGRTLISE